VIKMPKKQVIELTPEEQEIKDKIDELKTQLKGVRSIIKVKDNLADKTVSKMIDKNLSREEALEIVSKISEIIEERM